MTSGGMERYLSDREEAIYAFDKINSYFPNFDELIGDLPRLEQGLLYDLVNGYLNAGLAYFDTRGYDEHLKRLGNGARRGASRIKFSNAVVEDIPTGLRSYGIPISEPGPPSDRPLFVFWRPEGADADNIRLLIPHSLVLQARTAPIEALVSILFISSYFTDMINHETEARSMLERASAGQAHFLHEAIRHHPDQELSEYSTSLVQGYPLGLMSLPPHLRYWENV